MFIEVTELYSKRKFLININQIKEITKGEERGTIIYLDQGYATRIVEDYDSIRAFLNCFDMLHYINNKK